jgi:hypothetical protein
MPNDLDDIESFWEGLRPNREVEPEPAQSLYSQTPDSRYLDVSNMIGLTMSSVIGQIGGDSLRFTSTSGTEFELYHEPDCCESLRIEDIIGDLEDLVGYPLVESEELTSEPEPELSYQPESYTWTFYRFSTVRGTVTIRWLGESNGYYSEGVDFRRLP